MPYLFVLGFLVAFVVGYLLNSVAEWRRRERMKIGRGFYTVKSITRARPLTRKEDKGK